MRGLDQTVVLTRVQPGRVILELADRLILTPLITPCGSKPIYLSFYALTASAGGFVNKIHPSESFQCS
jgi:hypothetical protein